MMGCCHAARGGLLLSIASFCTRCGYANVQGHTYCPNCGNPLTMTPSGGAAPPPAGPPPAYAPTAPPPGYPTAAPAPPAYWAPPAKRATIGTMVGDTLSVWAKDVLVYVAVLLVYAAVITGLTFLLTYLAFGVPAGEVAFPATPTFAAAMDIILKYVALTVTVALVGAVLQSLVVAMLTYFAVQRYRGATVTFRQAFDQGVARVLSVLAAAILLALLLVILITIPVGLLLAGAALGNLGLVLAAVLFLIVALVVFVYVYVALSLYAPAIMMEGKGAVEGLRRSWEITRRRRGSLFLAIVVVAILAGIVSAIISLPFGIGGNAYVEGIGTIIASAITGAWSIVWAAVAYHLILSEPRYGPMPPPYAAPAPMPPAPPPT